MRRNFKNGNLLVNNRLGKQVRNILKDFCPHKGSKFFSRIAISRAHDLNEELPHLNGNQARVILLDMRAKQTEGANMNVDVFLRVLDDDGLGRAPAQLVHVVSIDKVHNGMKRRATAGKRMGGIAERGESAVSRVELDLARTDKHAYLRIAGTRSVSRTARPHIVGKNGNLRLRNLKIGPVGKILVGIAE